METLFKGMLLGFAIAAPVGPIGVLCIRRTVQFGRFSGLFTGLGAAIADLLYAAVAALGITLVSDFLIQGQFWLRLTGGIFLLYLGLKTFFSATPDGSEKSTSHNSLYADFFSTFFLTLTNPLTIISFLAVFAALGLSSGLDEGYTGAIFLLIGVFCGSSLWWLLLSEGVTFFRKKVSHRVMGWINRIAGILICLFGVAAWISLCW